MLEFEREELSLQLKAEGNKGQYWLDEQAWIYLERVTPTPAGPNIEKLGTFSNIEDAMKEAERLDK